MADSVWKGMISFGLVTIPIRLFAAARSKRTYLHQIHNACNTRSEAAALLPHVRSHGGPIRSYQRIRI